jgi:hypothetical protein
MKLHRQLILDIREKLYMTKNIKIYLILSSWQSSQLAMYIFFLRKSECMQTNWSIMLNLISSSGTIQIFMVTVVNVMIFHNCDIRRAKNERFKKKISLLVNILGEHAKPPTGESKLSVKYQVTFNVRKFFYLFCLFIFLLKRWT